MSIGEPVHPIEVVANRRGLTGRVPPRGPYYGNLHPLLGHPRLADPLLHLQAALAGRYTIERELGRGGMATVYLARDLKYDRPVALKVLRPELAAVLGGDRFLREIGLTARLQHPHILPLLDSGDADGLLYYVMPYVAGQSLRERLDRGGPLPLEDALAVVAAVAAALDFAHGEGIVHRDIKPENILLQHGEAMVADFGIALALSSAGGDRITQTGISLGTPAYMSPEQASAEPLDGRADIYSLGCVLYEILSGQPPYTGPTAHAILARCLTDPVPHVSTICRVPPAVDQALVTALAKDPADRFATAGAFATALRDGSPAPPRRLPRRVRRQWVALGATTVAVVAAAFLWLRSATPVRAGPGRVAVLYFDTLSPDSTDAYLADGLTEEIIARLGGVSRLAVQSRTAVKRFRGKATDPEAIGRTLDVAYLVTGSVQRSAARVRVRVELARAKTGAVVWGTTFDRPVGDVLSMEDTIAQAVAQGVGGGLAPAERTVLTARATRSEEAYDHYLRGNWYLNRRAGVADGRRALEEYQAALRLDPGFAEAYGRLGLVYGIYANWPWDYPGLTTDSLLARGLAAADRALALNSAGVDGWLARGFLLIPHPADAESRRAFTLDPVFFLSVMRDACPVGHPDCAHEAVTVLDHATALAPRDAEVWYQYGRARFVAGFFGVGSIAAGDSALWHSLALDPDRTTTAWLLSISYLLQRRWREAEAMIDSAMALRRHDPRDFALRLQARLGQGSGLGARADLDTVGRMFRTRFPADPASAAYVAMLHILVDAHLGDSTAARRQLAEMDRRYPAATTRSRIVQLCLAAAHIALGGAERERGLSLLDRIPGLNRDGLRGPVWDPVTGSVDSGSPKRKGGTS
jgi:eukaryotic-like serine/threonine-protein kinase